MLSATSLNTATPCPVLARSFLRDGWRLLHANAGSWAAGALDDTNLSTRDWRGLRPTSVFCASFWRPGWGLYSGVNLVELRLKPDAQVCVFSCDVYSMSSGSSRYLLSGNVKRRRHICKNSHDLAREGRYLHLRDRNDELLYENVFNEVWVTFGDIEAIRKVGLRGQPRDANPSSADTTDPTQVDTRVTRRLRLNGAGPWVPVT